MSEWTAYPSRKGSRDLELRAPRSLCERSPDHSLAVLCAQCLWLIPCGRLPAFAVAVVHVCECSQNEQLLIRQRAHTPVGSGC